MLRVGFVVCILCCVFCFVGCVLFAGSVVRCLLMSRDLFCVLFVVCRAQCVVCCVLFVVCCMLCAVRCGCFVFSVCCMSGR